MQIERTILWQLEQWRQQPDRKPLILQGARQTGKTWAVREFGKRKFQHYVEFNFEKMTDLATIFRNTKDVSRILSQLSLYAEKPINPSTLIFFDEIQECNDALNALKYFCEDAPEYHIIAAGSLLGVALSRGDSFPVGKVNFMTLYPITFKEFLKTVDESSYYFIENFSLSDTFPDFLHNKLTERYRQYITSGGMPEVLTKMIENGGSETIERVQNEILRAYQLDFSKHISPIYIPRIADIWQSIPSQLSKENRKFIYKIVKEGARAREYENALEWLRLAGLVHKIYNTEKPNLPLKAYQDVSAFKIYLSDVGLLRRLADLPAEALLTEHNSLYAEFKGAMSENYILQSLISQLDEVPHYWTSKGTAEVDFIIRYQDIVIPIEVKSAHSVIGKSLSVYNEKYAPKLRIRFSMKSLKKDDNLLNIPLFLSDWLEKWIEMYISIKDM